MENSKRKSQRTRSHDPTSSMRIRGSIQIGEDAEKISIDFKPRTNSERRKRKKTNVTTVNPHFLPKIHSQRTLIIPRETKSKCNKIKLINLNFQEKLRRNMDGEPEIMMTSGFGSVICNNLPPEKLFEKPMVMSPMESRM